MLLRDFCRLRGKVCFFLLLVFTYDVLLARAPQLDREMGRDAASLMNPLSVSGEIMGRVSPGDGEESLLDQLFRFTEKGHQVLGYRRARVELMGRMYLQQDENNGEYFIRDVYCLKDFSNRDFSGKGRGIGPNQVPDNEILNVEHTWPQSRFNREFSKDMQKSDLHHLFPSDTEINAARANYKFAEIEETAHYLKCDTVKLGRMGQEFRFEPPTSHKGNVARALFYFSTRYRIKIEASEEAFLRKWHMEDPVDAEEKLHHEQIFAVQGNRNPYIDRPELVEEIPNF